MKDITVPKVIELFQFAGSGNKNRKLDIPTKFGKGYCRGFVLTDISE